LLVLDGNVGGGLMPALILLECKPKKEFGDKAVNYICVKEFMFDETISVLHRRAI
jgi:hypothetical protein